MTTSKHVIQLCFYTIFIFSTLIYSQNYSFNSTEISSLDSLLHKGQFEKIEDYLKKKDNLIKNYPLTSQDYKSYNQIKNQYVKINSFIESISRTDPITIKKLIEQFNSFKGVYNRNRAGKKASELYTEYSKLVNKKEYSKALVYYRLARFFRIKHIRNTKSDISITLVHAYKAFSEFKYLESFKLLSLVDSLRYKTVVNSAVLDSIARLHSKLQNHFNKEDNRKKMWERDEVKDESLNIKFGFGITNQNEVFNTSLKIVEKDLTTPDKDGLINYWYQIRYLPPSNRFSYLLALNYKIKQKLFIGTSLRYSEFRFESKEMRELIFFDFKMNMIACDLYLKYLFRNKVGLRPYIKLGLGSVNLFRSKSMVSILNISDIEDVPNSVSRYTLKEKRYNYSQLLLSFGIDYLNDKESNWIIGFYSSFIKSIDNPNIIGDNHFQISGTLGFILN